MAIERQKVGIDRSWRSIAKKWGSIAAGARSPFWVLERTLNAKTLA
jgi:hypothetical protein